jgi:GMP synthase-like glutamine amidotransferase
MYLPENVSQKQTIDISQRIDIKERLHILLISCESKDVIKRDNFPPDLELFQWSIQNRTNIYMTNIYAQEEEIINIENIDGIILWWSSSSVYENAQWISKLRDQIKVIYTHNIPLLWCCFWSHIIADTLWWMIWKWKTSELGIQTVSLTRNWEKDPLFYNLPNEIDVITSHEDDIFSIGNMWTRLAYNQVSSYQSFSFWALTKWVQFHPEYTIDTLNKMEEIYGIEKTSKNVSYVWKQIIDNFFQHIVYENKYWK